jgi:hypothetical protein
MDNEQPALTDWEWAAFVVGFCLGIVIGMCLGVVAALLAEPRE